MTFSILNVLANLHFHLWGTTQNVLTLETRTRKCFRPISNHKETRRLLFVMLRVFVQRLHLNISSWQKKQTSATNRQSLYKLCSSKPRGSSTNLVQTWTFVFHMPYISIPAYLTRWCTSSWMVDEYCTTPVWSRSWSTASDPYSWCDCRIDARPYPALPSHHRMCSEWICRSATEKCVTPSFSPRTLKYGTRTNDGMQHENDSIAVHFFPNMSGVDNEKNAVPYHFC